MLQGIHLSPIPNNEQIRHLWIILTHPDGDPEGVVQVNLTSYLQGMSDPTVILKEGDHPFIHHDTAVCFARAKLSKTEEIKKAIDINVLSTHQPVSEEILEEIQKGLLQSPETQKDIKEYCRKKWSPS